jgi:hypothetical protein
MVVRSIDSNCDDGGGMEIQMAGRAGEKSSLSGISIVSSRTPQLSDMAKAIVLLVLLSLYRKSRGKAPGQGNVPFGKNLFLRLVLTSQMSRMYRVYVGIKKLFRPGSTVFCCTIPTLLCLLFIWRAPRRSTLGARPSLTRQIC